MKRYSLLALALVSSGIFAGSVMAQEGQDQKKAEKLKQFDELIIRKKSDKDEKVVIEIKDGEVTINGKPLEDYDNDNLSVRRGRGSMVFLNSPFRKEGGVKGYTENYNGMGASTRTFLGVITEEAPGGARITTVSKGSPAEKAGLKEKDIITKIGGEKVQDENDVSRLVRKQKPEDKVAIVVLRDGKEVTVNAVLGKSTEPAQNFNFSMPNMDMFHNFDFKFEPGDNFNLSPRAFGARGKLGIKAQDTESGVGVKVLDVADESAADKSGIKEDDIITEFNGKKVNSADELAREATEAKDKAKIPVKLLRDGKSVSLDITIPKKLKTANL